MPQKYVFLKTSFIILQTLKFKEVSATLQLFQFSLLKSYTTINQEMAIQYKV